jgi:hypothetical protein
VLKIMPESSPRTSVTNWEQSLDLSPIEIATKNE